LTFPGKCKILIIKKEFFEVNERIGEKMKGFSGKIENHEYLVSMMKI